LSVLQVYANDTFYFAFLFFPLCDPPIHSCLHSVNSNDETNNIKKKNTDPHIQNVLRTEMTDFFLSKSTSSNNERKGKGKRGSIDIRPF